MRQHISPLSIFVLTASLFAWGHATSEALAQGKDSDVASLKSELRDVNARIDKSERLSSAIITNPDSYENPSENLEKLSRTLASLKLTRAALEAAITKRMPRPGRDSLQWDLKNPKYAVIAPDAPGRECRVEWLKPAQDLSDFLADRLPSKDELDASVTVTERMSKARLSGLGKFIPAELVKAGDVGSKYFKIGAGAKKGFFYAGILDITKTFALDENVAGGLGQSMGFVVVEVGGHAAAASAGGPAGAVVAVGAVAIGAEVQSGLTWALAIQIRDEQPELSAAQSQEQAKRHISDECASGAGDVRFICKILPGVGSK